MTISAGEIAQARKLASASRRRLVDVLEETQDGDADAFTARLAKTLRLKIEQELDYPSTIKITVIREQRYTETAT